MISVQLWLLVVLSCLAIPTALLIVMLIIGWLFTLISNMVINHRQKKEQECPYKIEKEN